VSALVNPASANIDSRTRFRVKSWRGVRVESGFLKQGDEFPRGKFSYGELVAMMAMGNIEPYTPTDQAASSAAVQGIEPGDDYDDYPDEDEEDHAANKPARKPAPPKRGRKPAKR
jgi:hypothetical protein